MASSGMSGQGQITGINITPLVDVCLVLVIIFMVAAPLLMQPSLSVELPKAFTEEGKGKDNITITITRDGRWALNEKEMNPAALEQNLSEKVAESRDRYVIVRADRETPHLYTLKALHMAKRAGARDFAIATEQKQRAKKRGRP
ncbi:MAG: biopolymer transporter ExbD [bacterium]